MDSMVSVLLLLCLVCPCVRLLVLKVRGRWLPARGATLPPGPRGLPVIGNLFDLGHEPHVSLARLSRTYGPIMALELGCLTTIVISSPDAAREAFQTHAQALSSRPIRDSVRVLNHDSRSIAWMPAKARWRHLRRIAAMQLLTSPKLELFRRRRFDKAQELLEFLKEDGVRRADDHAYDGIDLGRAIFIALLNMISNTLFSVDFARYDSDSYHEFHEVVLGVFEVIVKPNVVDFFPVLRFLDPQRVRKQSRGYVEKTFGIFDTIINERSQARKSGRENKSDVLDSLLDLTEEDGSDFCLRDLKHILLDLFVAGVEPSSSLVAWAMKELVSNPVKMRKAQAEIRKVVGSHGCFQESDIVNLPYLQAVVKETLRLHPPAPLLMPYKAESDCLILGHLVPKGAQVLVNAWGMGRDPGLWGNADTFEPERLLGGSVDVRGRDFELIPFGAGRRICPGLPLAHRMVHLVLGSLLHQFDWKFADGVSFEDPGATRGPLRAIPLSRSEIGADDFVNPC